MDFPLMPKTWKKGMHSFDIVYPNKKYGGSYNLGMLIIYNIVNSLPNWICNRVFLDEGKITSRMIGFTMQYELDYYNFIKMLEENNIPLDKKKREQIIFAGGPFANTNPFALAKYVDALVLGDAEETFPRLLGIYENSKDKQSFLRKAAEIPGVFVEDISKQPTFAYVEDMDSVPYPMYQPLPEHMTKDFIFGDAFLLEVERGCPFSCKFCPMPLRKKIRHRSLEKVKEIIDKGIALNRRKKVILYTPSFSHPQKKEILRYLLGKGLEFSLPSIRVDIADEELLGLVKQGGQRTLTIAPECDEDMRFKIGKPIKDEKYLHFVEMAKKLGFDEIKCYFMFGLPEQKEENLANLIALIKKIKEIFHKTHISMGPFVPKPGTALESYEFDVKTARKQAAFLKRELGRERIRFKLHSISSAYKEWQLSKLKQ